MEHEPLVSMVTPFYNTAPYIAECIESVLAQTYSHFEYLLVDNKSTDGSREIAARYAGRDPRIKILENAAFLDQLRNFNGALERISPSSKYVKMVLADDAIFPECVQRMVEIAEREPTVAIVSSYRMWGEDQVDRAGLPLKVSRLSGREACRQMLVDRLPLTGSQTTVLYRADVVRARRPFFAPDRHFSDIDTAIEILLDHDLGFVHQVLSFTRTENESIWTRAASYEPLLLLDVMELELYGDKVLSGPDLARARARARRDYLQALGRKSLRRPGRAFWDYHRAGLAAVGWRLGWLDVLPWTVAEVLHIALNPENTLRRAVRWWRRRRAAPRVGRPGPVPHPPDASSDVARGPSPAANGYNESLDTHAGPSGRGRVSPPLVSIIVNNFNYGRFLRQSIESALAQDHPRTEVIVVDDASTDGSGDIIRSFGDRIVAVCQEQNGGQAAALNAGFAASRGDLVIFLDADDYLYPNAAAAAASAWAPGVGTVQYRLHLVDGCGKQIDLYPAPEIGFDTGDVVPKLLETGRYEGTVTSGNAFARTTLCAVLPIPEEQFRLCADGYLITTAPFYGAIAAIEEPLGAYRLHGANLWSAGPSLAGRFRRAIRHDADKHRVLAERAAALGLRSSAEPGLGDYQHLGVRLGSLCLEPELHPIPSDTRIRLALRGARASWKARLPWKRRLVVAAWFLSVGVLPRGIARHTLAWNLDARSRPPTVDGFLKVLRRMTD